MERLLDTMAEKTVCQELEQDRLRELNQEAQSISYGDIPQGGGHPGEPNDGSSSGNGHPVQRHHRPLAGHFQAAAKELAPAAAGPAAWRQADRPPYGAPSGRPRTLPAAMGRFSPRNALPSQPPGMAVGLLLDESGSMASCDRATYARASAIILYDFCQALHIPVMVYGHTTGKDSVELYSYSEFERHRPGGPVPAGGHLCTRKQPGWGSPSLCGGALVSPPGGAEAADSRFRRPAAGHRLLRHRC